MLHTICRFISKKMNIFFRNRNFLSSIYRCRIKQERKLTQQIDAEYFRTKKKISRYREVDGRRSSNSFNSFFNK